MGMSRCAIYLEDCDLPNAVRIAKASGLIDVLALPIRSVSDQSGIFHGEIGFAEYGGWALIFADPDMILDQGGFENFASRVGSRKLLCWLTVSASGGLWFEIHENGRLVRKWVQGDGSVEENFGDEIPGEEGNFTMDPDGGGEWEIVDFAGEITGITCDVLFKIAFEVYERKV